MEEPNIVRGGFDPRGSPRPAGVGPRLTAFIVDAVLLLAWIVLVGGACTAAMLSNRILPDGPLFYLLVLLQFAVPILYSVLLECPPLQGTLGKYLVLLKVVGRDGRGISLGRSVGRTAVKFACLVVWPLLFLDILRMVITQDSRALHDLFAQTFVVSAIDPPKGSPPPAPPEAGPAPAPPRPEGITPARDTIRER